MSVLTYQISSFGNNPKRFLDSGEVTFTPLLPQKTKNPLINPSRLGLGADNILKKFNY